MQMESTRTIRRAMRGLTLVEMMATLAIVSVLTAASLRVAAQLSKRGRAVETGHATSSLNTTLENLLAIDMAHADSYDASTEQTVLKTRSSLDTDTLEIRHIPAVVKYEIRPIAGRNWLVRTQQIGDGPVMATLVCDGVKSFYMDASRMKRRQHRSWWKALPAQTKLTLTLDEPAGKVLHLNYRTN